jgi:hypothetical protein
MTKQQYAELLAKETGMGIVEVLALLSALWPMIQKLPCFQRKKAALMKAMTEEHRSCCRRPNCPFRLRRTIEKYGQSPKDFWHCMTQVAFAHNEEVATMMMNLDG